MVLVVLSLIVLAVLRWRGVSWRSSLTGIGVVWALLLISLFTYTG